MNFKHFNSFRNEILLKFEKCRYQTFGLVRLMKMFKYLEPWPLKPKVNETFNYAITKYFGRWNFRAADDPRLHLLLEHERIALLK